MKITIEGEPKEIAALVLEMHKQQDSTQYQKKGQCDEQFHVELNDGIRYCHAEGWSTPLQGIENH